MLLSPTISSVAGSAPNLLVGFVVDLAPADVAPTVGAMSELADRGPATRNVSALAEQLHTVLVGVFDIAVLLFGNDLLLIMSFERCFVRKGFGAQE